MDKRDKQFYYDGGMELKKKVNTLANACSFLYEVMEDEERSWSAKKDAKKEFNFLRNHMNTILAHYEKLENQLKNEGELELLEGLQEGFRFDN